MKTIDNSSLPIIGEDISWETMRNGLCRVTRFTPFSRVTKEQSQSFKVVGQVPYASLAIEILIDYEYPFSAGFLFLNEDGGQEFGEKRQRKWRAAPELVEGSFAEQHIRGLLTTRPIVGKRNQTSR